MSLISTIFQLNRLWRWLTAHQCFTMMLLLIDTIIPMPVYVKKGIPSSCQCAFFLYQDSLIDTSCRRTILLSLVFHFIWKQYSTFIWKPKEKKAHTWSFALYLCLYWEAAGWYDHRYLSCDPFHVIIAHDVFHFMSCRHICGDSSVKYITIT